MTMLTLKELDDVITNGWIMFDMTNKKPADPGLILHDTDNKMYYDTERGWSKKPPRKWKQILPTSSMQHTIDRRVMFDFDFWDKTTVYFFSYIWRKSPVTGSLSDPQWELRAIASFDDFGEEDDSYGLFLLDGKEVDQVYDTDELIRYIMDGCDQFGFNMKGMISNPEMLKGMSGYFIDYATVSIGYTAGISTYTKETKAVRLASRIGEYRDIGLKELTNLMWVMTVMADMADKDSFRRELIRKFLDKKAYTALEEYINRRELFITDEHSLLTSGFDRLSITEGMYNHGSLRMFEHLAYINKKAEENGGMYSIDMYFDQARPASLSKHTVQTIEVSIAGAYSRIKKGESVSDVFERIRKSTTKSA